MTPPAQKRRAPKKTPIDTERREFFSAETRRRGVLVNAFVLKLIL
jgi:hypothetical protein